jgi:hypothetical protein
MLDCAKSELMALAESKTPIQSLKDDLKPGGKLELDASRSSWKLLQSIHCHNMQIEYCFYLVKAMD